MIPVPFGDKTRTLHFSIWTMDKAEKARGLPFSLMTDEKNDGLDTFACLLYGGFIEEDPDITREEVMKTLEKIRKEQGLAGWQPIHDALNEAIAEWFNVAKRVGGPDPKNAG